MTTTEVCWHYVQSTSSHNRSASGSVRSSFYSCALSEESFHGSDVSSSQKNGSIQSKPFDTFPKRSVWVTSLSEARSETLRSKQYENIHHSLHCITTVDEDEDDDEIRISPAVSRHVAHILVLLSHSDTPLPAPQLAPVSESVCALVWSVGKKSRYLAVSPLHLQVMDIDSEVGTRVDGDRYDIQIGIHHLFSIAAPKS